MILPTIQLLSCLSLLTIALLVRAGRKKTVRYLFPSILAASIAGIVLAAPYLMEIFVVYYSGAIYEMEGVEFRLNGPYWWVYYSGIILPLLPILAVIPPIKRRLLIVAALALLGMVPVAFSAWQNLAFG